MRSTVIRAFVLATIIATGAFAMVVASWQFSSAARVSIIVTAHQLGPVGYRDPAGAISPDGRWVAYSEGRFLRVRHIEGGPVIELPPGDGQIRYVVWNPNSRTILADGDPARTWVVYDIIARTRQPLWPGRDVLRAAAGVARIADLRQLSWSPDGRHLAGVAQGSAGQQLWTLAADGLSATLTIPSVPVSFPTFTPGGELACISTTNGRSRVTVPCNDGSSAPPRSAREPDLDVYGPIAFSSDRDVVYAGMPSGNGTLDLWAIPTTAGRSERLTSFSRDTYAPSVAVDGTVLFKVSTYRTIVGLVPAEGGPTRALATMQSETPSWHPKGSSLGITFGAWRRVIDDAKYPDIAQDVGIIGVDPDRPASAPAVVVQDSVSEDQSLCWSPNLKWIVLHSHKDMSDDLWLRPAEGNAPAKRITFLGRGAETGWPRWSPDGRWILFTAARPRTRDTVLYLVGIDQEAGEVKDSAREIAVSGISGQIFHGEWLPDSASIIALAKTTAGKQAIFTMARTGGSARIVHEFASEHDVPGLAVSPDGRDVAFVAPSPDGFFQVFRMPVAGGQSRVVTTDRSNKTQPTWSPDGKSVAFTVWSYEAAFMALRR